MYIADFKKYEWPCKQIVIDVECKQNSLNTIRKVLKFGNHALIKYESWAYVTEMCQTGWYGWCGSVISFILLFIAGF
jgi:hypothetical protein